MTGTTRSTSVTSPRTSHASSTAVDVGHVGHRAAGVEVGQEDLLVGTGEDVGRLGHEVHAAEDDELGLRLSRSDPGESERVAPCVRPRHHFVALVVVAEDDEPRAELVLGPPDASRELVRELPPCSARAVLAAAGTCRMTSLWRRSGCGRRGQPGRPSAGMSAPER